MPVILTKEWKVQDKTINLYGTQDGTKELPLVLLHTCQKEGQDVFEQCIQNKSSDFILAAVSGLDWNQDMTPWYMPKSGGSREEYPGGADAYIRMIGEEIMPRIRALIEDDWGVSISYCVIAGYSLAGLFAVYSAYKTDLFTRIVSASGSFWFPGFLEFVKENEMHPGIEKVYFSLGNKESKTKNRMFKTVEANTRELETRYRFDGICTIYEENEGNHFQDAVRRMAKGIVWVLKEKV